MCLSYKINQQIRQNKNYFSHFQPKKMIPIKAYLNIYFLCAIIKLSLSQTFLSTYFELYAKENDVTQSFWNRYQLASTGYYHKITLTECISYCSSLKYCFSISLNKDENYCRVFNEIPLLDSQLSPANGSDVYIVAGWLFYFRFLICFVLST